MRIPRFNPTFLLSIAVLALALSGTALAASASSVIIRSGSGKATAIVSKAGQLLTTEAAASQYLNLIGVVDTSCNLLYHVPARKALVVTNVIFTIFPDSGQSGIVGLFRDSSCGNFTGIEGVNSISPGQSISENLGGYVFRTGSSIYSQGYSVPLHRGGDILLNGYLIPASAALPVPRAIITGGGGARLRSPSESSRAGRHGRF